VEKFVSRRTSSSGSNVGPAVTMQFMMQINRKERKERKENNPPIRSDLR
jgi:hypothetical protein